MNILSKKITAGLLAIALSLSSSISTLAATKISESDNMSSTVITSESEQESPAADNVVEDADSESEDTQDIVDDQDTESSSSSGSDQEKPAADDVAEDADLVGINTQDIENDRVTESSSSSGSEQESPTAEVPADETAAESIVSENDKENIVNIDEQLASGSASAGGDSAVLQSTAMMTNLAASEEFTIEDGVLTAYTGSDTDVVIPESVTKIGTRAFASNSVITSVTLPSGLTEIGSEAFYACNKLSSINLDELENLTTIGNGAFAGKQAITDLDIPEGVITIGDRALGFDSLTSLSLPATLQNIGSSSAFLAFASSTSGGGTLGATALTTITIADGNENYSIRGDAICSADGKTLYYIPSGLTGTFNITDGVETISENAAKSAKITGVTFPPSVTEIGANTFCYSKLTSVSIPGTVKTIGSNAFYYCGSLTSVQFGEGVETIGHSAFSEDEHIKDISLPASVSTVESYAFDCLASNGSITILNAAATLDSGIIPSYRVITVYGYTESTAESYVANVKAASSSSKLVFSALTNPEVAVEEIALSTAVLDLTMGQTQQLTVDFTPGNATDKTILWSSAYPEIATVVNGLITAVAAGETIITATSVNGKSATSTVTVRTPSALDDFTIVDGVLTAYKGTTEGADVVIPNTVTKIGAGAFGSAKIASVTLPASVTEIGASAFANSTLSAIHFSSAGNLTKIGEKAFETTQLTEIDIPEGVTELGYRALRINGIQRASFPASLTVFGTADMRFVEMFSILTGSGPGNLTDISFANGNSLYRSENGAVYNASGTTLVYCPAGKTGTFSVSEGTQIIAPYAFSKSYLTSATLPDSLTEIGQYAFESSKLTSIDIPGSVITIGRSAFFDSRVRSLTLGEGVQTIAPNAFNEARISGVVIPASVTSIGAGAFDFGYGTNQWIVIKNSNAVLEENFIPYNYNVIKVYAAQGSTAQQYVQAKATAYPAVNKLQFVLLNSFSGVKSIALNLTEARMSRQQTLQLTAILTPTDAEAQTVAYNSDKPTVASVSTTGLVTALQPGTAIIKATVNGISATCTVTVAVEDGESDFVIDENGQITGFIGSDSSVLEIPSEVGGTPVTGIANAAFKNNTVIKTLIIPANVQFIGESAFEGCSSLTTVTLNIGLQFIGASTFQGCSALTAIAIPEGVSAIEKATFSGCQRLSSVILPSSVTTLHEDAFARCSAITSLTLPEGLTTIKQGALQGCLGLTALNLPASLTTLGSKYTGDAFDTEVENPGNLLTITVSAGSKSFSAANGLLYNVDGTEMLFCPRDRTTATVQEGATRVGPYAFYLCFDLESVIMPSTLKSIGEQAFHFCEALTDCTLPEGLETLEDGAFFGCESWGNIIIPSTVRDIGSFAFLECAAKEIVVPEGITRIEEFTFWGYEETLESVTLPSTLTYIGDSAFAWSKKLTGIVIPDGVIEIGKQAFGRCDSLSSLTLPKSLRVIGDGAFWGNANAEKAGLLTSIYIPSGVTTFGSNIFMNYGSELTLIGDSSDSLVAKYATTNGHSYYNKDNSLSPVDNDDDSSGDSDSGSNISSGASATISGSVATSTNVTQSGEVSTTAMMGEAADALKAAQTGATAIHTQNAQSISAETLRLLAQSAVQANKSLVLYADTMQNDIVQGRLTVEPTKLLNIKEPLKLGVYSEPAKTAAVAEMFETYFDNTIRVVQLEQQGSFGARLEVAAKVDLSGLATNSLQFYSYDAKSNSFTQILQTSFWVDQNGYLHFYTQKAGSIIISDKLLTLKK